MTSTVLLIDDDQALLDLYRLKFSLEKELRLLTAERPEEGLELAARGHPSLILLDLVLPKEDGMGLPLNKEAGFALLRKLKETPETKDIPVVVFTNLDGTIEDNLARAKALGAADYWVKAKYEPAEVVEKVTRLVVLR